MLAAGRLVFGEQATRKPGCARTKVCLTPGEGGMLEFVVGSCLHLLRGSFRALGSMGDP